MGRCDYCKYCNKYFGSCNLQDFQHCVADCSNWDEVYENCKKIGSGTLDALAIALMNGATYERSGFGGDSELQLDAEATARNLRRGGWLHVSEVLEILKEVEAILPTHWSLPEEFNGYRQKLEMIKQEVLAEYGVKE